MRLSKKEFLISICISFTIISLGYAIIESILNSSISRDHFNLFLIFTFTCLAIGVLSQFYRLNRLNFLLAIIIQYLLSIVLVFLIIFSLSYFIEINSNGYLDIFKSFTVPYVIGAVFYYVSVKRYVKKQNQLLKIINK
ncbi:MAG: DUF3021 family protein [Clostridiaceae bacterium]|nr:DUF3021 family protein [Clostridiaceae bacterium]